MKGLRTIRAVVFDMDGTLTKPSLLDFAAMRSKIGILPHEGILPTIDSFEDTARRKWALEIVEREERAALSKFELQTGTEELLKKLREHKSTRRLYVGIITRNAAFAVENLLTRLGETAKVFDDVVDRSFVPYKPDPAPLIHLMDRWKVEPCETIMIGDYIDDVTCANSAGAHSCLLRNSFNEHSEHAADVVIKELLELLPLLQEEEN